MIVAVFAAACAPGPSGLRATPPGDGPEIVVDWDREPFAEIPYPNDLAARTDPLSPTGLRLNLSTVARTERATDALTKLDSLAGFGTYTPITAAFDAPLDLDAVLARHPDDHEVDGSFDDDAVFLFDVTPGSPTYLQPVALDLGGGRFPADTADPFRYWNNDPRGGSASLIFDGADEDLDGNGVLDPGEDTDGDGVLDIANVWPEGGDAHDDLLTWYERSTNTLILRSVLPLRGSTRYAVVLTERLVGVDGEPVRSPWAAVNHTRQTEALLPVLDALADLGMGVDDVAFAWTFTTAPVVEELWEVTRGLALGQGSFQDLSAMFPPGVTEAHTLQDDPDQPDPYRADLGGLFSILVDIGLVDDDPGAQLLVDTYDTYGDALVGGAYRSPWLLPDADGDGSDADELWRYDLISGLPVATARRVPFTCALPAAGGGVEPPFDVAAIAHGYGGSRLEALVLSWTAHRIGMAVCAVDHPGHGLVVSPEDLALVEPLLDAAHLGPFLYHLQDNRARDLDNDGVPDSGGDMFSADPFHSRDLFRQDAVDLAQLVRSLEACGTGRMGLYNSTALGPERTGESRISCDWDDDGTPDLGGPDARVALLGASLGGVHASISTAVVPGLDATVAIVPGGGMLDMTIRSEIGGAVESVVGRLLTPAFVAVPAADGFDIAQLVVSVDEMKLATIGHVVALPVGGTAVAENLVNGEVREIPIPGDGLFRVAIPADAPDAWDKAVAAGIPAEGAEAGVVYSVPDNAGLGDALELRIYDAAGGLVGTYDTFGTDVVFESITYATGSPLVALSWGNGEQRTSPDLRRTLAVMGAAQEPGDPIVYARHWLLEPLKDEATPVLVQPTAGDTWAPINGGIALARAAGLVPVATVDERYGTSIDRFLIDRGVVSGLEEHGPYVDEGGSPILFDPDDLDRGTDGTGAPSEDPLRATVVIDAGTSGLRVIYVDPHGSHGWFLPEPDAPFDVATFATYQAAWFAATGELSDAHCLETGDCAEFREMP